MPAAFVQSKSTEADGVTDSTTIAATFTSTVGSGNAVCGAVTYRATGGTLSSVTDDKANTYTIQRTITGDDLKVSFFYLANITNAPQTITATFASTIAYRGLGIVEASGIATTNALDQDTGQAQAAPGGTADAVTSGAVTTTTDGQFIFGASARTDSFVSNEFTAGTNYTEREETGGGVTGIDMAVETRVQTSQGSIAATFTGANGGAANYATGILTLKAASGAWGPLISDQFNRLVRT